MALLGGCESISKDQCEIGDWVAIGQADGAAGRADSRIADYAKDCGRYGIKPDIAAYQAGRSQGLLSYCTAPNGFEQGRRGKSYANVCPPALASEFQSTYSLGRELWQAEDRIKQNENRIKDRERDLDNRWDKINKKDCDKAADPNKCRKNKRRQREDIDRERRDLRDARWDLEQQRRDFADLRADIMTEISRKIPGYRPR